MTQRLLLVPELAHLRQQEQQEQKKEQDARAKKERLRQELLQAREVRTTITIMQA